MATITKSQLISLQKTLKTDEAIGKKYGISRQAVHQLRQKYEVDALTTKNKERDEQIVSMFNKGVSGLDIAKKNKLSVSQTYRIIKSLSKPAKKKKQ